MKKVSVVIPLYNKSANIVNTVQTVLEQTYSDFELIVVDDCSSDGGADLVRAIEDQRIRVVSQPNGGVSKARNTGIALAQCELIAFIDADDEWTSEHLSTLIRLAEEYPEAGIYATAYTIVTCDQELFPNFEVPAVPWEGIVLDYFKCVALGDNIVNSSTAAIKKSVFNDVGGFPERVRMAEDQDMWLRAALKYHVCFSWNGKVRYRCDAANRACSKYYVQDLNSPIFTAWFDYKGSTYLMAYISKVQSLLLRGIIISGHGREAREVLKKMYRHYGIKPVFRLCLLSLFPKSLYDLLRIIKKWLNL